MHRGEVDATTGDELTIDEDATRDRPMWPAINDERQTLGKYGTVKL
jgi:hypothetical protein